MKKLRSGHIKKILAQFTRTERGEGELTLIKSLFLLLFLQDDINSCTAR